MIETTLAPWRRLGFGEPVFISAIHDAGVDVLLDSVVAMLRERGLDAVASQDDRAARRLPPEQRQIRVAIVGQPNVGKVILFLSLYLLFLLIFLNSNQQFLSAFINTIV